MASPRSEPRTNRLTSLALFAIALAGACTRGPGEVESPRPVPPAVASDAPQPSPPPPPPAEVSAAAPAPAPVPPPPPPEGLRATTQSRSEIAVSWQGSAAGSGPLSYELFRGNSRVSRTDETRAVDRNLRPGTRYCYTVQAVDPAGRTSASPTPACTQTLDTDGPTTPLGVKVVTRPGNAAELSWSPSTDDVAVTVYELFRSDERVATVREAFAREDRLAPGKEHCWKVKAVDAAGNRSAASDPTCTLIPDTTPPTVPAGVTAGAPGERSVDLAWSASQDDVGVARYEIEREGGPALVSEGSPARAHGLAPARRYCFTVRACDAAGNCSAPSPEACATTPDLTPPTSLATLAATARSDVAVELAWPASTDEVGVVGYEVKRGDEVVAKGNSGLAFTDGGLRPATKYCYAVIAMDAAGNRSGAKRACATTLDLTPPSPPGRAAAVSVSSSQLFLGWDPSTDDVGVAGYEVLRDGAVIATVPVTHMRERGLPANAETCYTVRAFDAYGNRSQPAGPACARTADPSLPASPSDLRVVRVSSTEVLLQWEPSEQAGLVYRIYTNGLKSVGLTRWNTYSSSGRIGGQPNCYRVAAVDEQSRESPPSNEVCATTRPSSVTQR